MDRTKWTTTFNADERPLWTCPSCGSGSYVAIKKSFHQEETRETKANHGDPDWEPEWDHSCFSGILKCNNPDCLDVVAVCGITRVVDGWDEEHGRVMQSVLVPVCFSHAPHIIQIPSGCPESVSGELNRAFSVFWCDAGSAANRIRTSVELLLTHFGVARFRAGTRTPLSTHERIVRFGRRSRRFGEVADALLAVKWIGNAGSHPGGFSPSDALDGFEILENVLVELFEERTKRLGRLVREINRV